MHDPLAHAPFDVTDERIISLIESDAHAHAVYALARSERWTHERFLAELALVQYALMARFRGLALDMAREAPAPITVATSHVHR